MCGTELRWLVLNDSRVTAGFAAGGSAAPPALPVSVAASVNTRARACMCVHVCACVRVSITVRLDLALAPALLPVFGVHAGDAMPHAIPARPGMVASEMAPVASLARHLAKASS